jgi:hypothetical protein
VATVCVITPSSCGILPKLTTQLLPEPASARQQLHGQLTFG